MTEVTRFTAVVRRGGNKTMVSSSSIQGVISFAKARAARLGERSVSEGLHIHIREGSTDLVVTRPYQHLVDGTHRLSIEAADPEAQARLQELGVQLFDEDGPQAELFSVVVNGPHPLTPDTEDEAG